MASTKESEVGSKRKPDQGDSDDESSSDDEAGPQPAAPGQIGEDSDTDGETGPPKPEPLKPKKKRKLAHEKVRLCVMCWGSGLSCVVMPCWCDFADDPGLRCCIQGSDK